MALNCQSTRIFWKKKTAFLEAGSQQARGHLTLSYASRLIASKTYVSTVYTPRKSCQINIKFRCGKSVNNKIRLKKAPYTRGFFFKQILFSLTGLFS